MPKVLLTGGSGFIAAHVLELLLKRGHEVVTTVRSEDKASKIRDAHPNAKLTVVIVPDIAQPGAFDEVMQTPGLEYVQHTASPFHFKWSDAKTELLDPAIKGTTSVLEAVKKFAPGVKRVVITSSFAAILSQSGLEDKTTVFSEADWNPSTYEDGLNGPKPTAYRVSKKYAEKAGWDFVANEKPNFDLATICPPMVFGPVVHHLNSLAAINTSNERFVQLIRGEWKKEIPPTGVFLWVDVRDVALAHVNAMEKPEAGGKRFLTTAGHFSNRDLVTAVRKGLPDLADKLPDESVKGGELPEGVYGYDNLRATKVLGIDWTPIEKSAVDTVKSLQEVGA
ncbi:Uu.00g077270.m01.CDS01 [Anthostomella pinea]|uniref:Uu.00g077270.m01.CDS01 n=1 Tax=Anthostomella pinea TaxID=933095 RepID=A0AAI8VW13_9PEZI|nr:Uu.00g077270.m01.CDS01 [Anthostomella pinea]